MAATAQAWGEDLFYPKQIFTVYNSIFNHSAVQANYNYAAASWYSFRNPAPFLIGFSYEDPYNPTVPLGFWLLSNLNNPSISSTSPKPTFYDSYTQSQCTTNSQYDYATNGFYCSIPSGSTILLLFDTNTAGITYRFALQNAAGPYPEITVNPY